MATKSITVSVDGKPVEVIVRSARKIDGIWRAELMMKASEMPDERLALKMAAFYLYPTCMASVDGPQSIRSMSFEDFMDKIDEADIDAWIKVAYELNPQWQEANKLIVEMSEAAEKKTGTSSNGSKKPTGTRTPKTETSQPSKS